MGGFEGFGGLGAAGEGEGAVGAWLVSLLTSNEVIRKLRHSLLRRSSR
jgi:hypothetical protein